MSDLLERTEFRPINRAYDGAFQKDRLTLGLVAPIEAHGYEPVPTLERHLERVALADELGFAAVWLRDVPFNVPAFGDAGQTFDPFVYLGLLAGATRTIGLGVASVILPLRHPAHVAKAAASVDVLSGGRLLLGVASGDRPEEYPAMNKSFDGRGEIFRESFEYIRAVAEDYPAFNNAHGSPRGMDVLPKPTGGRLPLLITGGSRQTPDWVAANGDGWITYPRSLPAQHEVVSEYRERTRRAGLPDKPVAQSLYVDVVDDPHAPPVPIHLGFRSGIEPLRRYLTSLQDMGVNHVALNLRFSERDTEDTVKHLAEELLPFFPTADAAS